MLHAKTKAGSSEEPAFVLYLALQAISLTRVSMAISTACSEEAVTDPIPLTEAVYSSPDFSTLLE